MPNKKHSDLHLVVQFNDDYRYFLEDLSDSNGKCFGASLNWSIEFLKEVADDKKALGFSIKNQRKFFNNSACAQNNYERILRKLSLNENGGEKK